MLHQVKLGLAKVDWSSHGQIMGQLQSYAVAYKTVQYQLAIICLDYKFPWNWYTIFAL